MKKILILSFAMFIAASIFGQANVYKPFPNIYGDWWVLEETYNPTQYFGYLYFTSGDTLINNLSYKKVNYINQGSITPTGMGQFNPPAPLNQVFTGGTYNFAYRNDSLHKKVFIVPGNSTQEHIWYDFNLAIGDTVSGKPVTSGRPIVTITDLDSILICGNYYRSYVCTCSATNYNPPFSMTSLIEGSGFTTNFLSGGFSDLCAFEPTESYGTSAWSEDACQKDLLAIKKNQAATLFVKLFPNPSAGVITIQSASELGSISLYNSLGQSVYYTKSKNTCESIDIEALPPGIYTVQVKDRYFKCIKE